MCWECDHPDATRDDYLDHVREKIARFGWAIQHVEGDRIHPPWSYTVGLTMYDEPELVVTGLPMNRASALLHIVAKHPMPANLPRPGQQLRLIDGPTIQIIQVAEPTAHLHMAVELFGPGIGALQVVHADGRGHWPWEPGYRGGPGGQPVLGIVTPLPDTQPATPAGDRRPERARVVRTQPSRGSGSRRGTRGPQRQSARSRSRRPSPRR
jgi:hypothetical protein